MGRNMHDILPYITGGILCFSVCGYIFNEGAEVFLGAGRMIKNHAYPFTYHVFESICKIVMTFAHNLLIFYIVVAMVQALAVPHWTFLIGLPVVLVSVFTWGSVVGLMAARFRDLRFMLPYVGQLLFYVTPIIWQVTDISNKRSFIAHYNPMYGLLELLRAPLLGQVAPPVCWSLALGTMFTGIIVWFLTFAAFRKRIPFWV
jgi:ABC-2 type transport system permease protein/lipopolysaccharide transport system permease protein